MRRQAIHERSERARMGLVKTSARGVERELDREASAAERAEKRKAAAARRQSDRRFSAVAGLAGQAVMGLAGSAIGHGGDLVGGAVRESLALQAAANRVSINSRMPGQQAVDPNQLREEFQNAAISTPGISSLDVAKGAQAYVDLTGDVDTARNSLKTFATVASATGATVEDVATAAASLGSKFDVKKPEDMRRVFAGLIAQGKGGAITMKDLAAQFQKLAAAGDAFDIGKGPEAISKLGGLVQVARSGTRSPQQAGTAVENIFSGLTSHTKQLHQYGVSLYGKGGEKRDIDEILAETISKVGGSNKEQKNAELIKIFGKQGMRAINPLVATYNEAAQGKTGKAAQDAGFQAVLEALHKANAAATDWGEVEKDAAQAQKDASAQLQAAWETLKAAAGEKLAPELAKLATTLANGGGLDGLATIIAALGESAQVANEALKAIGLLKPKEQSAREELQGAQKEYDKYDKEYEASNFKTPEMRAKRAALKEAVDQAYDKAYAKPSAVGGEGAITPDAFAQRYQELDDPSIADQVKRTVLGPALPGLELAGLNPTGNDFFMSQWGENKGQRQLRQEYQGQEKYESTSTDSNFDKGAAAHEAAADKVSRAAEELMRAAEKLGRTRRGSVTGGTD